MVSIDCIAIALVGITAALVDLAPVQLIITSLITQLLALAIAIIVAIVALARRRGGGGMRVRRAMDEGMNEYAEEG